MKLCLAAALLIAPAAAFAQTVPTPAPATAAPAAAAPAATAATAARFTLDTPIETIAADTAAKAVLDADLPGVTTNEHFEMFKSMSLRQLQPFSQGRLTDGALARIERDLAAIH